MLSRHDTRRFVSAVTAFELSNKYRIGKMDDVQEILQGYERALNDLLATELPVSSRHSLLAGALPGPHRDPFDRLIAAQSVLESLTLVSADPAFDVLGVRRLW
jgi:PIN domain nuclease of toxin-antitoxin system